MCVAQTQHWGCFDRVARNVKRLREPAAWLCLCASDCEVNKIGEIALRYANISQWISLFFMHFIWLKLLIHSEHPDSSMEWFYQFVFINVPKLMWPRQNHCWTGFGSYWFLSQHSNVWSKAISSHPTVSRSHLNVVCSIIAANRECASNCVHVLVCECIWLCVTSPLRSILSPFCFYAEFFFSSLLSCVFGVLTSCFNCYLFYLSRSWIEHWR